MRLTKPEPNTRKRKLLSFRQFLEMKRRMEEPAPSLGGAFRQFLEKKRRIKEQAMTKKGGGSLL